MEKLALKTKKLNPDESLPPTIELTVRYLLEKAAATRRTEVSAEPAQVPSFKSARVFNQPPNFVDRTTVNLVSPAAPTPTRPTTFSCPPDDDTSVHPPTQTTFQVSSTTNCANVANNIDVVELEDFDEDFDDNGPSSHMQGNDDASRPGTRLPHAPPSR